MTTRELRALNRSDEFVEGAMYAYERVTGHAMPTTDKGEDLLNAMRLAMKDIGYEWDALFNPCRLRELADIRNILWHIYRDSTGKSYANIEKDFGGTRVGSTIRHGCVLVDDLLRYDTGFALYYARINNTINNNLQQTTLC